MPNCLKNEQTKLCETPMIRSLVFILNFIKGQTIGLTDRTSTVVGTTKNIQKDVEKENEVFSGFSKN